MKIICTAEEKKALESIVEAMASTSGCINDDKCKTCPLDESCMKLDEDKVTFEIV